MSTPITDNPQRKKIESQPFSLFLPKIQKMRDKIVVIGGGFAGLQFARKLSGKSNHKVILIDKMNHHMFQPLFYQVACGRIEPSNISFPFRRIFNRSKNVQFRMTEVEKVLPEENKILTLDGVFSYDKLVIATGCRTNFFGNQTMKKLAYGMKNTEEAIAIRNEILMTFEKLIIEKKRSDKGNWNIVIVGSGPTGVELAGAFSEMKKEVLPRDYPYMNFDDLKIILVSATDTPLKVMSEEAQQKSEEYLKELGVEFWSGDKVIDYDGTTVFLKSGEKIESNNVIWAAGVTGNIIDGINEESQFRNRYKVNEFSQIKGHENIYAIGDIAYMETENYPKGHPQVANVAINQGKNLAKNFQKQNKTDWQPFVYNDQGSMATIGKHRAVVDLPKFKFQGIFAWYFWMFLHLMLILSVKNKIAIFMNWMWSYFNNDSSLRLIITPKNKK